MMFQSDLDGRPTITEDEVERYCCPACYNALEDDCVCQCGGRYHGLGVKRDWSGENKDETLPEEIANFFRSHFKETLCDDIRHREKVDLSREPIRAYPHSGGWSVNGRDLWLYVVCPVCGYQWSIWKLGVSRALEYRAEIEGIPKTGGL